MRAFLRAASVIAGLAGLAGATSVPAQPSGRAPVALYTAAYDVDYKGRNLGSAVFSVTAADDGTYLFESRTEARGLLKLVRPNPLLERSRFEVADGRIRPCSYVFEDGSRRGGDNFRVEFEWDSNVVVIETESGRTEHALTRDVLDRGSMQVALMRDLARGARAGPYVLVDEDGLKTYRFEREAEQRIETPAGAFDTHVYGQRREDSSRITRLWVAPSLEFLPVRIAQFRDGELYTDFMLEEVEGL